MFDHTTVDLHKKSIRCFLEKHRRAILGHFYDLDLDRRHDIDYSKENYLIYVLDY